MPRHARLSTALPLLLLALGRPGLGQQNFCPTVTQTQLAASCSRRCGNADCSLVTTVQNPCGCPGAVATATLVAPCQAECPYGGCGVEVRTLNQPCAPPPQPSRTTTTTTSVSIGITQLPPPRTTTMKTSTTTRATTRPCPTVTLRTQPADCPAIRCPVPGCVVQSQLELPCGCAQPRTVLRVDGCQSACPEGYQPGAG